MVDYSAGEPCQPRPQDRAVSTLALTARKGGHNPATQVTEYGYDDNGNRTSIDGPLAGAGDRREYTYDALNRLRTETHPLVGTTHYGLDALDQLSAVTDPRQLLTGYTVNALGELTQLQSPDTGTTVNSDFDAAGNLRVSTDARGVTRTATYDELNRVSAIAYPDQTLGFSYDEGANGKGRLTGITDRSGSTGFEYDPQGRLTRRTQVTQGKTFVVDYGYTDARLTTIGYPSGAQVGLGYDGAGRVETLSVNGQLAIRVPAYHPFGGAKTVRIEFNGVLASRSYDLDGRIWAYAYGASTHVLTYDEASRLTSRSDALYPNLNHGYGYDSLDRLTGFIAPYMAESFSYDDNGNRTSRSISGNTHPYTVATGSNRLEAIAGPTARSYTDDASGSRVTESSGRSYGYDGRGRLTEVQGGGHVTAYRHNALGE